MRDKLIEIIQDVAIPIMYGDVTTGEMGLTEYEAAVVADHLIANGVTVQEWISVKDRLPAESGKYLVRTNRGNVYQTKFYSYPEETGGHWGQKDKGRSITHWTHLPQPPKMEVEE